MTLHLDDHWIWDFWFAIEPDGAGNDLERHHLFFLKAPKSIGDPDLRHWNVSIGHAISDDLLEWTVVDDVLAPSEGPAWDDKSTWTGSVMHHDGRWVMMYTGTSHGDDGLVQRVGLATSDDLYDWERLPDPVLTADPEQYETLSLDLWHDEAWRDPWMFTDPSDGHVHVFLTARANEGSRYDRGVIGHARSVDLLDWEVLAPIAAPDGFGQLEVPQLIDFDDRWYVVFASDTPTQSEQRRADGPGTGTFYLVGDSPYGPFEMLGNGAIEADAEGSTYAGRIHRTGDGSAWFVAWNRMRDGEFVGTLAAPRRVECAADGRLVIAGAAT